MRLHLLLESGLVDGQVSLSRNVCGQVERKPIGVVQLEDDIARQLATLQSGYCFFEYFHALVQRLGEAALLFCQHLLDMFFRLDQFGIGVPHFIAQGCDQLVEERFVHAQFFAVTRSTTNDSAQHIATTLIARQHAVRNQERTGANVINDHIE